MCNTTETKICNLLWHVLVYLCVLSKYTKYLNVRCKVAKFIQLPKVSPKDTHTLALLVSLQFYNTYLYKLDFNGYATIFYQNNDVVHFYNDKSLNINRIIPIYDYKSRKFSIMLVMHRKSGIMWGSWRCVKAPNGNLYAVYVREVKSNKKELLVYNLSKGKIVHKVEYEYGEPLNEIEVNKYVHILLNSFVVICKIEFSNLHLHLVDLISETADTFIYTPYDYMNDLLKVMDSEEEKEHIRDMLSTTYFLIMPSWMTLRMHENVKPAVSLLSDDVPFVKYLDLVLSIESCKEHERIDEALVIAFEYENNELEVRFSTSDSVIITIKKTSSGSTSSHTVKPPAKRVLFSKKYKLNSSYDISKSHPYYIHKVSKKFIFGTDLAFEHSFIGNLYFTFTNRSPKLISLDGITILQTRTGIFANLEKYHRYKDGGIKLYAIDNYHVQPQEDIVRVLDLSKVRAIFQQIGDREKNEGKNFINISDCLITFNVREKIKYIIHKIYEKAQNTNIDIRKYYYYLDETKGNLYISVMVSKSDGSSKAYKVDFHVFECNIMRRRAPCRILMYSGSYDLENFYKSDVNYSDALSMFASNADNKIQLLEIFARIGHANRIYIHDNEIMLVNDVYRIKISDIKCNRQVFISYVQSNAKGNLEYTVFQLFDRNTISPLTLFTDEEGKVKKFRLMIILSDLKLVKSMALSR